MYAHTHGGRRVLAIRNTFVEEILKRDLEGFKALGQ